MNTKKVTSLATSEFEYSRSEDLPERNTALYVEGDEYLGSIVSVTKEFEFDAGHFIPNHPKRCKYVHGHRFKVLVTITGPVNEEGVVVDFQDISSVMNRLVDDYDHGFLNDYYEYPTAENIACHIHDIMNSQIKLFGHNLRCSKVRVYETPKCYAEVGD